jgi:hypothetical protein
MFKSSSSVSYGNALVPYITVVVVLPTSCK